MSFCPNDSRIHYIWVQILNPPISYVPEQREYVCILTSLANGVQVLLYPPRLLCYDSTRMLGKLTGGRTS